MEPVKVFDNAKTKSVIIFIVCIVYMFLCMGKFIPMLWQNLVKISQFLFKSFRHNGVCIVSVKSCHLYAFNYHMCHTQNMAYTYTYTKRKIHTILNAKRQLARVSFVSVLIFCNCFFFISLSLFLLRLL